VRERFGRTVLAFIVAMAVLAAGLPAGAQSLLVPMTGSRTRQIQPESLFQTLFHDFFLEDDRTTYVQTGDIPAMWLRDSSAQTIPYIAFQPAYPILRARFAGVIERNARNVLSDPYANAFSADYRTWERKWEIDSLAFPVLLAWIYWQQRATARSSRTIFTTRSRRSFASISAKSATRRAADPTGSTAASRPTTATIRTPA